MDQLGMQGDNLNSGCDTRAPRVASRIALLLKLTHKPPGGKLITLGHFQTWKARQFAQRKRDI